MEVGIVPKETKEARMARERAEARAAAKKAGRSYGYMRRLIAEQGARGRKQADLAKKIKKDTALYKETGEERYRRRVVAAQDTIVKRRAQELGIKAKISLLTSITPGERTKEKELKKAYTDAVRKRDMTAVRKAQEDLKDFRKSFGERAVKENPEVARDVSSYKVAKAHAKVYKPPGIPKVPQKVKAVPGKTYVFSKPTKATLPKAAVVTTPTAKYTMETKATVVVPKGTSVVLPKPPEVVPPEVKPAISPWMLLLAAGIALVIVAKRRK